MDIPMNITRRTFLQTTALGGMGAMGCAGCALDLGGASAASNQKPYYAVAHIDDPPSLAGFARLFEEGNPGYRLGCRAQHGEAPWQAAAGSRVAWIQDGRGEVFVPKGYRTKEGDGAPLPPEYRPEPAPEEWLKAVRYAATRVDKFQGDVQTAIRSICSRLHGNIYVGDAANDLWAWIEYDGVAPDPQFAAFINLFERVYDQVGFSTKTTSGWEAVQPGDQILVGEQPLRVRGDFRYWFIDTPRPLQHISALRRLRYLKDTAGGCNFQFDAFRRMSMTYYAKRGVTKDNPDGVNQANSHFVNIANETSRAHYHPSKAVGGGKPQCEMYFVADPAVYGLSMYGRKAGLTLWPQVETTNTDMHESVYLPLRIGSAVYITPGTGHRGIDVFSNIVTLPGFKPKNQVFIHPGSH
jgi:hypothetical protein